VEAADLDRAAVETATVERAAVGAAAVGAAAAPGYPADGVPDAAPHRGSACEFALLRTPVQPPPAPGAGAGLDKPRHFPLSRTTDRVLQILLNGDLARIRADRVAEELGISCTTLRRRLRADHTSYQFLLDRARQYRCERRLRERWLPGKCLADELGYTEVNSFYRAFRRWTGRRFSDYKLECCS
jgi:AraC-like DNA-binding protein